MTPAEIRTSLEQMREYFDRSTKPLVEEHSQFAPAAGLFTVAGQVAHVAQTVEWFFDTAFTDNWRMEFEAMDKQIRSIASLAEARAWFQRAVDKAICVVDSHTAEEWARPFNPNPILGELPRFSIVGATLDHTAHHRGALTVYQRLLGLVPPMPYTDM